MTGCRSWPVLVVLAAVLAGFGQARSQGGIVDSVPSDLGVPRGPIGGRPPTDLGVGQPAIYLQNRGNQALNFALCGMPQTIDPGAALTIPICDAPLRWHDGRVERQMSLAVNGVYEFYWAATHLDVRSVNRR
jgi:hypothetical protein